MVMTMTLPQKNAHHGAQLSGEHLRDLWASIQLFLDGMLVFSHSV